MRVRYLLVLLPLAACNGTLPGVNVAFGGSPLVSGASPANQSFNSEPQPVNSLPPGAEGLQSSGPNNTQPNDLSATVSRAR